MLHLSYNTFGFNPTVISSKRRKKKKERCDQRSPPCIQKIVYSCLVFHPLSEPLSGDVTSVSVLFHIEGKLTAATQAPSDVSQRSQSHFPALVAVSVIMMISGDRCTANEQKQQQQRQHTNKYTTCSSLESVSVPHFNKKRKRCSVMVDSSHVDARR